MRALLCLSVLALAGCRCAPVCCPDKMPCDTKPSLAIEQEKPCPPPAQPRICVEQQPPIVEIKGGKPVVVKMPEQRIEVQAPPAAQPVMQQPMMQPMMMPQPMAMMPQAMAARPVLQFDHFTIKLPRLKLGAAYFAVQGPPQAVAMPQPMMMPQQFVQPQCMMQQPQAMVCQQVCQPVGQVQAVQQPQLNLQDAEEFCRKVQALKAALEKHP